MGTASRRKRERRERGFNQRTLRQYRELLTLSKAMGGVIRMAMGSDGVNSHYVVINALAPAQTVCALQPGELTPSEDEEPTCMLCAAIKEKDLGEMQWEVAAGNMMATAELETMLKRLGG